MKLFKLLTAAVVAVVIFTAAASAETINTIEQIEQTALLNNLEYKTAVLDVTKAVNALESRLKLDKASLTLSGSYPLQDGSSFGGEASALLPVFDQLSLSAAVDQDLTGTFGLSLNPLTHSDNVDQSVISYNTKLSAAEEKATETADTAVKSYLEWVTAKADYQVKLETADVKKLLYEDEKIRFEKGESDLDDIRDAFTSWSESRTNMNTALSKLQTAETGLYTTLNIDPADYNINSPAEADLFNLIKILEEDIDTDSLSISSSYAVFNAENEAESLILKLNNTWLFEPNLSLSGKMVLTAGAAPELSATASLSFGLDDWNADERKELATELEISRQQAAQTVNSEQLNLQQALTTAKTAAINYEVAEVELEQAKELLDEAGFLYELGEYSAAELDETALIYEQSKNSLFSAAAEHYLALRDLSAYSK